MTAVRVAGLGVLCALLLAIPAGGRVSGNGLGAEELYWLGPYFAGMPVSGTPRDNPQSAYVYGDCELPEGEGGCAPPVQLQNGSTCERNPIMLDRLPERVFSLRAGGIALAYEPTAVDVATGRHNVTVYTNEYELMGAALRDMRPRSQAAPQPLAPPRYPRLVLGELKRVTALEGRGIRAIAKQTKLHPSEVRMRLRIAELLGPKALKGVPVPTISAAAAETRITRCWDGPGR